MTSYVALLRGVNLAGRNRVGMDDLRKLFAALGHGEARTHLQSGNVLFESHVDDARRLAEGIEKGIAQDLGVAATVLLRTADDLARVVAGNPFVGRQDDPTKLLVTFLAEAPAQERAARLEVPAGEPGELALLGREVYLHCPDGYGRSKLSNAFIERRLGVAATTRNWRVVGKLHELASA